MPSAPPVPELPRIEDIEDAVRERELGLDAPELHGALCGWLAGGGEDSPRWLAQVLADEQIAPPAPGSVLDRMRQVTVAQMEDRDFAFHLLVPDDTATLFERSGRLFDWCRGFLSGFGLAAGADPPLSEESREALADLAQLAAATAQEEGDEGDEDDLTEIEEFVRVAALLLHGDCAIAARHRRRLH